MMLKLCRSTLLFAYLDIEILMLCQFRASQNLEKSEDPKMQKPCPRIFGFGAYAKNLEKSEDPKIRRCSSHARESSDLPCEPKSEDCRAWLLHLRIFGSSDFARFSAYAPNPKIRAHGCYIFGSSDLRILRGFLRTPQIRRFARMAAASSDLRFFGCCEGFCVRPKSEDSRAWLLHLRIFGSSDFARFSA